MASKLEVKDGGDGDEKGDEKVELKKVMGLPSAIALIIGSVIGSGIFVSPTAITRQVCEIDQRCMK